jgi:hypothetical protein
VHDIYSLYKSSKATIDVHGREIYQKKSNSSTLQGDKEMQAKEAIMSLKKSAEIAALFSGAKINQTTNLLDRDDTESDESFEGRFIGSNPQRTFSNTDLRSSLGYFP